MFRSARLLVPSLLLAALTACAGTAPPKPDLVVALDAATTQERAAKFLNGRGWAVTRQHPDGVSLVVSHDRRTIRPRGVRLRFAAEGDARTAIRVSGEAPAAANRPRQPVEEDLDGTRRCRDLLRQHFAGDLVSGS